MDLIRTDTRFQLQEARSENQELAEERFGYDSAYGISEKMILAPKTLSNYGHSKSIVESTLEEIAKAYVEEHPEEEDE